MSVYTVAGHRSRIDAIFARAAGVTDMELQADLASHLCVVVSGFVEQATRHIFAEYARTKANAAVARYVERQLEGFMNANAAKLCQISGAFNAQWGTDLEAYLEGQRKDALDSVVANRHNIAHGRSVGVTYVRIKEYYEQAKHIVAYLEAQCA